VIIILVLSFTDALGVFTIPIGYLLGSIAQVMYLIYFMKNRNLLKPSVISLNIREFGKVEKTFGLIIIIELVNQFYIIVDRYFYGNVDSGGLAALNYANVLFALPISIISLALSTAIFPKLAESLSAKNSAMSEAHYLTGLQINIFLFIPITFVFILFGDSLIKLFYQRGSYTAQDTLLTFGILKLYTISLIFYSSYAIINKAIYGAGLVKNLLKISLIVFLIKIALNFLLVGDYKQNGLALATSVSYITLSLSCYYLIIKKLKFRISGHILRGILFYTMNGILSYIAAITSQNYFPLNSTLNLILILSVFIAVYTINIFILKPKEFLIFKETLGKYLIY
jgi:putative peptidoglycan lipid II flippase